MLFQDDKNAEPKFREVSEAYEVLEDDQKRKNYDRSAPATTSYYALAPDSPNPNPNPSSPLVVNSFGHAGAEGNPFGGGGGGGGNPFEGFGFGGGGFGGFGGQVNRRSRVPSPAYIPLARFPGFPNRVSHGRSEHFCGGPVRHLRHPVRRPAEVTLTLSSFTTPQVYPSALIW